MTGQGNNQIPNFMKTHLNSIIIGTAIILAAVIYVFGNRYQTIGAGPTGGALDRFTGEVFQRVRH
jgi:hypothetical protein